MRLRRFWWALWGGACLAAGCDKKDVEPQPPGDRQTAQALSVSASTPSPSPARPAGAARAMAITKGKWSFMIDAPAEKVKGSSEDLAGTITVDPADLGRTRGEVKIKLTNLKLNTFESEKDNAAQTEHAKNWMEIGEKSPAATRPSFETATFTITQLSGVPQRLADVKEEGGARVVRGKAEGTLTLHGITRPKSIDFAATFQGPEGAPTEVSVRSEKPLPVSLKEFDIMPRDPVGKFLKGAFETLTLEKKKITDDIQVSLEVTAR